MSSDELSSIGNATPSPETITNSNTSPFQEHYNNQKLVPPKDKIRLILACCVGGIIENVSMDVIKEKSALSSQQLTS